MLESIVTQCQEFTGLCASMQKEGSQMGFVTVLTLTNLALLAKPRPIGRGQTSGSRLEVNSVELWQAGNVSIVLWLFCLVVIRMGAP